MLIQLLPVGDESGRAGPLVTLDVAIFGSSAFDDRSVGFLDPCCLNDAKMEACV